MHFTLSVIVLSTLLSPFIHAKLYKHSNHLTFKPSRASPAIDLATTASSNRSNYTGAAYFDQYIDHNNTDLGTFAQVYYWSTEFWGGDGYPIILAAGQESDLQSYGSYFLENSSIQGYMAQELGAAVIAIEHRYWGNSSPYQTLTTKNLQYLTIEQNIADLVNFASKPTLPFSNHSSASEVPWILMGGSYSGAATAWTAVKSPGTFWAYFATSAVVEAISDFWQYFEIVAEYAPTNCTTDLTRVVSYIDSVLTNGTSKEKQELKEMFGLESLQHDQDFVAALLEPLYSWQSNQPDYTTYFYPFCDAIENITWSSKTVPTINGVGLSTALAGYASFYKQNYADTCSYYYYNDFDAPNSTACLNTFNASSPIYTDTRVKNNVNRQWQWMLCNEPLSWWRTAPPTSQQSIISTLLDTTYETRQCSLYFPVENTSVVGTYAGKSTDDVNAWTLGWDEAAASSASPDLARLFFINGDRDPWRGATVASEWRPGGPLADRSGNTSAENNQPRVALIRGGFHCSDGDLENAEVNRDVYDVVQEEVRQAYEWVREWPGYGKKTGSSSTFTSGSATSTKIETSIRTATATATATKTTLITTASSLPTSFPISFPTDLSISTSTAATVTLTGEIAGVTYTVKAQASGFVFSDGDGDGVVDFGGVLGVDF